MDNENGCFFSFEELKAAVIKSKERLHGIVERRLEVIFRELYPDAIVDKESSLVFKSRADLIIHLSNKTIHIEIIASKEMVNRDVNLLVNSPYDIQIVVLIDDEIDLRVAREYFYELKCRNISQAYFPRFKLSDVLLKEKEIDFKKELKKTIEKPSVPVGIAKYLEKTINSLNTSQNLKYYIELRCHDEEHKRIILLKDYIYQWLKDTKINTLALLGDFGTGKTTCSQELTLEYAKRYIKQPKNNYLPIMIDLRSSIRVKNMEELFNNALMWKGIDYKDFLQLSQDGKLLLILDGFDEMSLDARRTISFENSIEVNKLIFDKNDKNKVIITSRTHYFKQGKDEESILKPKAKDFTGISLKEEKKIRIIYLEMFNEEDIEKYFKLYFKDEWRRYHERLSSIYNLPELSHRPILLNLIVQTLPELDDFKGEITQDRLYNIYIDRWTKREEWRDVRQEDVLFLMEELAFKMFISDRISITPQELMEIIEDKYKQKILYGLVNLENFDGKIRTASFLYRDKKDNYSFMHKSFMEFFVAKKFAKEIERGDEDKKNFGKKVLIPEIASFLKDLIKDRKKLFELIKVTKGNKFEDKDKKNFGKKALTPEIASFLKDLIKDRKKLFELIEVTKGNKFEKVQYLGGNAATILNLLGESFEGKDFSTTVLAGANLSNANLSNTNFRETVLKEANLTNAILKNADFSFSNLESASLWKREHINYIAWSPDDEYIASGGDDAFVTIWYGETYKESVKLKGHKGPVNELCWSPDSSILVSGSSDKNIIIWDIYTVSPIITLKSHKNEVVTLTWDKNKNYLMSGDSNGEIIIWDAGRDWNIVNKLNKKGRINKLKFINFLNYLVISSEEGIEILEGNAYNKIFQLCDFPSIYGINGNNNTLVYLEVTPELEERYDQSPEDPSLRNCIEKNYKVKIIQFDLKNLISEEIKSWKCQGFSADDYYSGDSYFRYESSTIYKIVDIAHSNKEKNLSIIIYRFDHNYEDMETNNYHYYDLVFFEGKIELNSIPVSKVRSISDWYDWDNIRTKHPIGPMNYSNNGKYLAFSSDVDYLSGAYPDKSIKVYDADPESSNFGKCLYTLKDQPNCEGMNIYGIKAFSRESVIEFFKKQGAIEKK